MPRTQSAWLLPTGEVVKLGIMSHAEVVQKFLTGLLVVDEKLAKFCLNDFKRFLKRDRYQDLHLSEAIEDYAVLCLRWTKIGNAYGFNNNNTITIADYDGNQDKIRHYQDIGYRVNVIPVYIHCYETISESEYKLINFADVIGKGYTVANVEELFSKLR